MSTTLAYFDSRAATYEADCSDGTIWSIAHRIAWRLFQPHLLRGRVLSVLDAGCGTGKWGKPFAAEGHRVTFSDLSARMVEQAVALAKAANRHAQVDALTLSVDALDGIPDASYDVTLCMGDPLSYASNPPKGIRELVRVTKPDGQILVSVDSRLGYLRVFKERDGYDLEALDRFLTSGDLSASWEGLPLHAFSANELRERFHDAGAETISIWSLPTVSAYFLFDPAFRERLSDPLFVERLIDVELRALSLGSAPGTHHLYGLFRRL
jgi:SAM-dependent methyltransferase